MSGYLTSWVRLTCRVTGSADEEEIGDDVLMRSDSLLAGHVNPKQQTPFVGRQISPKLFPTGGQTMGDHPDNPSRGGSKIREIRVGRNSCRNVPFDNTLRAYFAQLSKGINRKLTRR